MFFMCYDPSDDFTGNYQTNDFTDNSQHFNFTVNSFISNTNDNKL